MINSDFDGDGDGTLTVQTGKTITTSNGIVTITAWDMDMDGSVTAGTDQLVVHGAVATQTFGLGDAGANMHVEDGELGRMTASGGLTMGSSTTGSIEVDAVSFNNSDTTVEIGEVVPLCGLW